MRAREVVAWVGLLAMVSACGPKPAPTVSPVAPKYPQYTQPPVPAALAGTKPASTYDLAWRAFQTGDMRTAERAYTTAIGLSPSFYPAEAGWGYLELARGAPDKALPHFERALQVSSDYVSALLGKGQALVAVGRESEAVVALERALTVDPTLVDLQRRIDVLRFRGAERDLVAARQAAKEGRVDESIRAYEAAISNSTESAFLYRELAGVVRQKGDNEQALTYLRRATTLDPSDAASLAMMADILDARGDYEEAIKTYSAALALEPSAATEARRDEARAHAALARLPEAYRLISEAPQVTRADMAALVGIRMAPLLSAVRAGDSVLVTDVRGNWAEPWITTVVSAAVMDPYDNHTFQPRTIVRRADLAQVVSRLLQRIGALTPGIPHPWDNARLQFVDLAPGHLAYPAASAAVASGVLSSTPTAGFQPTRSITGAEAVDAVTRLEQLAGLPAARNNRPR